MIPASSMSDRAVQRIAAGFLAVVATALVMAAVIPAGAIALSSYSQWLRGYDVDCEAETISDTVSPSGLWIARVRRTQCLDIGEAGLRLEVALIPANGPRFLARRRMVFSRLYLNAQHERDPVAVKWLAAFTLELQTPPCRPRCDKWDAAARAFVPTGFQPCEPDCSLTNSVADVTVTLRPPES